MIEWMAEVFYNIAILIDTVLEHILPANDLHKPNKDKEQQP